MNQIARIDTNTLNQLSRQLVGFDEFFSNFEKRFSNQVNNNYPPYNLLKYDKDRYEIQIATTGFEPDEITVEVDQDQLIVRGEAKTDETTEGVQYLYRGLARRNFTRVLSLEQYVEVGEASIRNGILRVQLNRVLPESLKPRKLEIKVV
jgi:molecular chaperone IbpA